MEPTAAALSHPTVDRHVEVNWFEILFQANPFGIFILDDQLNILLFNSKITWMLGSSEGLHGSSILSLCVDAGDAEKLKNHLLSGSDRPLTLSFIRYKTNSISLKLYALRASHRLFVFLDDLTSIQMLEEELRNFRTAINSAKDAIFLFDEHGIIFYTNPAFEHQVGLSTEHIIGTEVQRFWNTQMQPMVYTSLWQTISDGNPWVGELNCVRSNRTPYEVEVCITPIKDEAKQIVGFISVQRDITLRKEVERLLADYSDTLEVRVEERTEALSKLHEISHLLHRTDTLEKLLRLVLIAATAGESFRFNRAFLLLVNKAADTLEGRSAIGPSDPEQAGYIWRRVEQLPRFKSISETLQSYLNHESQGDAYVNWLIQQLTTPMSDNSSLLIQSIRKKRSFIVHEGKSDVEFDPAIIHKLGSDHFAVIPLLVSERAIGVLVVDNAITRQPIDEEDVKMLDILAAQAALAIAHADAMEQLAQKVNEAEQACIQLRHSQEQLVQQGKFAALGQMAATVAHEIRTPLVAIGGFANMLLKKCSQEEKLAHHLAIIRDEALRLEDVLNRLLFYARPSTPMIEYHNLNALVDSILSFMQAEIEYHQVKLEMNVTPNLPAIPIDRNLIRQVIVNIVQNGIQSMEKGGTLWLQTYEAEDWVFLIIRDTGVGIVPEHLNRIYEPFFSTKNSGTGLGLHVSQRIIAGHGGAMTIESQVGVGTTVTIRLPKREATAHEKNSHH